MTQNSLRLGVIGLGAMGAEMLDVARNHPDVQVVIAADPGTAALERARATHPDLAVVADPAEVLAAGLDAVYIASPPATHAGYAVTALTSGKAVFCEKPLAIDLTEGAAMVDAAEATGLANALNFTLSDRAAAVEIVRAVREGEVGEIRAVDISFSFPEWPRAFQRDARWVAGREQGGFLREVASHYVFLTDRVLGPLDVLHTRVAYGPADEVSATGLLSGGDGGVPVRLAGQVAAGPETYEWTLHGTKRSYRFTAFATLWAGDADGWTPVELDGPRGTEATRLAEFVRSVRGEPSTLADFATGLRVQRAIEAFHRGVGDR
jgi:1,5-anhydro-D-fructose reductase (1,5-anhydro-D-mannitol-forming)